MNKRVREEVLARAGDACECGCGKGLPPGELDHVFGRGRAESVESCWMLTPRCHFERTNSFPDAETWWRKFIEHALRHGYSEAAMRATGKLAWVVARKDVAKWMGRAW